MPGIDRIAGYADELTAIRRHFHEHPALRWPHAVILRLP